MEEKTKTILALILLGLILSLHPSCTKIETTTGSPCPDGDCNSTFEIIYKGQTINPSPNGEYNIPWDGLNYFQITGQLEKMEGNYVEINDIPQIDCMYDSDYWVVFDSLSFTVPQYSYLGWFNDNTLSTPIPIGNYTYTMNDLIASHPPYNIAGYQIPKHFCTTCPYAPTIIGSHSRYNYNPTQNFMLDDEMIGDQINVFVKVHYNNSHFGNEQIETFQFTINII
tara:strand:+ start:349 stop:1023 length:675 start_codon:yes stop_codon:yes gene_type:complete